MKNTPEKNLIAAIEDFLSSTGMKPTRFGKAAMGDANLIKQLRDGRELRIKSRNKVLEFIKFASEEKQSQPIKKIIPLKVQS